MFPRGEQQMKEKMKAAAVVGLAGTILATGGCLGNWQQLLINSAITQAWEFVLDNDAVFDLFEDGATGA
jgi:hypothetical protein